MSNNVAIITGITGQDGAYLAKLLISKGYKIIGVVQDSNNINKSRLEYLSIADQILWQQCELTKKVEVEKLLQQQGRLDTASPRILEVNPSHVLIRSLNKMSKEKNAGDFLEDAAFLLLDQAYILEGESPIDAQAFGKRLADTMKRGFTYNHLKESDESNSS